MGNLCLSEQQKADKLRVKHALKKSKEIDNMLVAESLKEDKASILLCGPDKKAFIKQLKILQAHKLDCSEEERKCYKYIVYGNCITQMKILIAAAEKLGNEYHIAENKEIAETIAKLPAGGDSWSSDVGEAIASLWSDKAIKQTYQQRDKSFYLDENASYFFDNIERFCIEDYVPSVDDILRIALPSNGVETIEFELDDLPVTFIDVGGLRSEKRKWIHYFDNITAIIFVTSLAEYDQTLREDDSQNRMKESLLMFDEVSNSPWFKEVAILLVLTDTDLFHEKIQRVDLNVCFPEYTGGCNDEAAMTFIMDKFREQNQIKSHTVYAIVSHLVDIENAKVLLEYIRETLALKVLAHLF